MCGDEEEGIELAVGHPRSPESNEGDRGFELPQFVNRIPSDEEMAEFGRSEDERRKRLDASPLYRMSRQFTRLAITWIQANAAFERHTDPILREAFEIVCWDSSLLTVKLRRALDGRDQFERHEEYGDDDPIQNDWNGSAKVALISIQRSAEAWSALGTALGDAAAASLGDALGRLRRATVDQFPDAMRFKRPGFDDLE